MKIQAFLLSLIIVGSALLAGCENTAKGFGQDMQNTGKAIEKTADGK